MEKGELSRILEYGRANKRSYLKAGNALAAHLTGPEKADRIKERVAFAILSANCPFDASVKALSYAHEVGLGNVQEDALANFQCVPFKAKALRELATRPIGGPDGLLRVVGETWAEYRERLAKTTPGLGRAKAAFAASLLYPMRADVACLDTWMCKTYLGTDAFKALSRADYERVEGEVRTVRDKLGLPSTFLAQWIIWNHARGQGVNKHDFFPGTHKDAGTSNTGVPF